MFIRRCFLILLAIAGISIGFSQADAKEGLEIKDIDKKGNLYYSSAKKGVVVRIRNYSKNWIDNVTVGLRVYDKESNEIAVSEGWGKMEKKGEGTHSYKKSLIGAPRVWWRDGSRQKIVDIGSKQIKRDDGTKYWTGLFKIKGKSEGKFVFPFRDDFESACGKPKYYKVELKVDDKLVDVMTKPKTFLKTLEEMKE